MSQWKIRAGSALLLFLIVFAYPTSARACSCSESGSPADEFARAAAVFSGKVTRIREISYGYRVHFAVTRSWKGISTNTTEVTTGYGNGDCGYPFNVGETYVVYAYGMPDDLNAVICTRTAEVSRAVEDLSYLGTVPPLFVASTSQLPWPQTVMISLIVASSWLFLVRGWLFRRQRRGQL
jgi:hypothetical protein